jgi:hydroxyacylglutathione hydrolase
MRPIHEVFTVGPFQENTYLLGDADAGEAVVIDPGGRIDDILRVAELRGVRVTAIANTHSHIDHVTGVAELRARTGAPFYLHADGVALLAALPQQAAMFGLPPQAPPAVDRFLVPGEALRVGGIDLLILDTPGHAPGHVTLLAGPLDLDGLVAPRAWVGDVIFAGSIGRTDLPGGDYDTLLRAIEREVLALPPETVLYSGHGPATTVGRERQFNPFVLDWLRAGRGPR